MSEDFYWFYDDSLKYLDPMDMFIFEDFLRLGVRKPINEPDIKKIRKPPDAIQP